MSTPTPDPVEQARADLAAAQDARATFESEHQNTYRTGIAEHERRILAARRKLEELSAAKLKADAIARDAAREAARKKAAKDQ